MSNIIRGYYDPTSSVTMTSECTANDIGRGSFKVIHESKVVVNGDLTMEKLSETTTYSMETANKIFNFIVSQLTDKYSHLKKMKKDQTYLM